jgi:hypothetical protein
MQPEPKWERFTGYEAPTEEEVLLDIRFDSGKELQNLYPWDVKWVGNNPGFGHVTDWRETDRQKRSA